MKYPATLWRCGLNFNKDDTESAISCNGHRYMEVGAAPGPCHHETVRRGHDGGLPIIQRCPSHMIDQGTYELEA